MLLYFLIALVASIIGSLSGIGGGVIIKPLLDAFSPLNAAEVGFLSTCTVLTIAVTATLQHLLLKTQFDKKRVIALGIGATIGGYFGTEIFNSLLLTVQNDMIIKIFQNLLLAFLLFVIFLYMKTNNKRILHLESSMMTVLSGLVLGLISSFLGIGGGPFNVAALLFLFGMNIKVAAANSILIVLMSQLSKLLTLVLTHTFPSSINLTILAFMLPTAVVGGIIGGILYKKIRKHKLQILYDSVLLFVIVNCIYNAFIAIYLYY